MYSYHFFSNQMSKLNCNMLTVYIVLIVVILEFQYFVYGYVDLEELLPQEIALVQFDSRPLAGYWKTSAEWNNYYCALHNHIFIYYTSSSPCKHEDELLASPWCKVKSMLQANSDYRSVKLFIYMDSDAVINNRFKDIPVNKFLSVMQTKLQWDPEVKPIVFNQDGPSWWCKRVEEAGYHMCLNAGTVMWYRHENSKNVLQQWWDASMDAYEGNPIKRKFRLKWPWEQDRQLKIYNESRAVIQIASQPDRPLMQLRAGHLDWCLSHLPVSGCFISHHCEGPKSKKNLLTLYSLPNNASLVLQRKYKLAQEPYPVYGFHIEMLK